MQPLNRSYVAQEYPDEMLGFTNYPLEVRLPAEQSVPAGSYNLGRAAQNRGSNQSFVHRSIEAGRSGRVSLVEASTMTVARHQDPNRTQHRGFGRPQVLLKTL